jgi:alkaline phosphatase D
VKKAVSAFCVWLILFMAASVAAQSNKEETIGSKQYKRVHQQLLDQITSGKVAEAAKRLQKVAEEYPEDAETQYMLAIALAQLGKTEEAITQKAIDAGLPPGRFLAGPRDLLNPLADSDLYLRLAKDNPLVHGPMVGSVTHQSAQFWVRTQGEMDVNVAVQKLGHGSSPTRKNATQTRSGNDFTGIVRVDGLEPNTEYSYSVTVRGLVFEGGTFRTAPAPGKPAKFHLAFGGGAGFVPPHEKVWNTILDRKPHLLLMLGDNVYIDQPTSSHRNLYTYYRRQSRPEWRKLVANTPTFSIWDDHDFGKNDCSGGPLINEPAWKPKVWKIFTQNWGNPSYGGGPEQPGCWYKFSWGDVDFIMLDCRYYRNARGKENATMLGPVQKAWLREALTACRGKFKVICSSVPWDFRTKGDSQDTWNGFRNEREEIFSWIEQKKLEGVFLMSADRHRSDAWRIERPKGYDLYEFNSSRLTNQHVHKTMPEALFSYNAKQSFGLVTFDTTAADSTVTYDVVTIDGETVHSISIKLSDLSF